MSYEPRAGLGASARALFSDLAKLQYHGVMFGQQDAPLTGCLNSTSKWEITGANVEPDVFRVSDQYPAVYGFDFGWITESELLPLSAPSLFNDPDEAFSSLLSLAYDCHVSGGIVTFSWHVANSFTLDLPALVRGDHPFENLNPGERLGQAFAPNGPTVRGSLSSVQASCALSANGQLNDTMKSKLTVIADFAKSLRVNGTPIPILFRPYHENNIGYFWWSRGDNADEDYKALWRATVKYLDDAGATNLLYVFSPHVRRSLDDFKRDFEGTYPGGEWVDVVAIDFYPERRRHRNEATAPRAHELVEQVDYVCQQARRERKLAAISECGVQRLQRLEDNTTSAVDDYWTNDYLVPFWNRDDNLVSYALIWKNVDPKGEFHGPYPGHSSAPNFNLMASNTKTLLRCGCKFRRKVLFRDEVVRKRASFSRWRGSNQSTP